MQPEITWDPATYAQFADHRRRPFGDLIAHVPAVDPALAVDLGCGNGAGGLAMAQLWPHARIVGVDSSEAMLEAARRREPQGRIEWVLADLRDWDIASLGQAPDVIVTNATLQWVPEHLSLIATWVDALAPGGWFAMQVPSNFDAPSHALMRESATGHPRESELQAVLERVTVGEPSTYLTMLSRTGCVVDAWETTYLHVLDPQGERDNSVLDWVWGTGLRPVLDLLVDEDQRAAFVDVYAARLAQAYPRTEVGVLLPFRRVFAVAHKEGGRT